MKRIIPLLLLAVTTIMALMLGVIGLSRATAPVSDDGTLQRFIVRKGQSSTAIGAALVEAGLVRSELGFKYVVARDGLGTQLQAGTFELSPDMTTAEIAQALTKGSLDVWLTVLEGWRVEEVVDGIYAAFVGKGVTLDKDLLLALAQDKEGYLFPDTYLIPLSLDEASIIALLERTFEDKLTDDMRNAIASQGRSVDQVVTIASLIEREARQDVSRKMVSDILWKRVDAGWPLNVDATLQYIHGYDLTDETWWSPPLASYKTLESPYNTYLYPGLPPGPICAVSLSSLEAAVYPTANEYWYYLTDNDGVMRYATDLDQHNANVATYLR